MQRHPKQNAIVREYLERVSWQVLDQYRPIVRDLIRGHSGVYALYRKEQLYYVGLARNLMGRVAHHLKDRHSKRWDRFSVYLTADNEHIRPLEALLLRIIDPGGNRVKGRLRGARDLNLALNRSVTDADADRRAMLLGGNVARQRRKRKTSKIAGSVALAGLVERPLALVAKFKGVTYRARLRRDGRILFQSRLYATPTAAAKAAIHRAVNGWLFWTIRGPNRSRPPLASLRR